jgi:hypothetical protein
MPDVVVQVIFAIGTPLLEKTVIRVKGYETMFCHSNCRPALMHIDHIHALICNAVFGFRVFFPICVPRLIEATWWIICYTNFEVMAWKQISYHLLNMLVYTSVRWQPEIDPVAIVKDLLQHLLATLKARHAV